MSSNFSYQFYNTTLAAWDAMYQALCSAQTSIYWELYALVDDAAGERFIKVLSDKAKAGLEVKLLIDSFGSLSMSRSATAKLKQAGVDLIWYNRLHPGLNVRQWLKRVWYRNHRKVLIIDEQTTFVGGVNVESLATDWDDVHIKITGPVSRGFLKGFAKNYIRSGGQRTSVLHLLKKKKNDDQSLKDRVEHILHSPIVMPRSRRLRQWYDHAFEFAKERIVLLTPYYRPDRRFLKMVKKARRRGVTVDVLLPFETDNALMRYVSEAFYAISERAGARLHFLPKMNHGKALSIDDKMGLVGSINFTPRSFFVNEEAGLLFKESAMVQELNTILNRWKQKAVPFSKTIFSKRGWWRRLLNRLAASLENYV